MRTLDADRRDALVAIGSAGLLAAAGGIGAPPAAIAVALILCAGAAVWSPIGGLGAVVLTLLGFYHPIAVGSLDIAVSELLLCTTLAAVSLRVIAATLGYGDEWLVMSRVLRSAFSSPLVLLALGLAAVGTALALMPANAAHRGAALRELRWTLIEPAVFVGMLVALEVPDRGRRFLAAAFVAACTLAAILGLGDLVLGDGVKTEGVRRIRGPFPHPNRLALFLVRGWAVALTWALLDERVRRWLVVPLGVMSLALVASYSRGGLVAAAIALLVVAFTAAPQVRLAAFAAVALGLLALISVAGARMTNTFGGGSVTLRFDVWHAGLEMIRDRPVIGYGPDGFLYAYSPRYIDPTAWAERFTAHAHNFVLDSWIRLGIIGGALALAALVFVLVSVTRFARGRGRLDVIGSAALIGVFAGMLHGLVDNGFFAHDLAMSGWLLAWFAWGQPGGRAMEGMDLVASAGRGRLRLHRVTPVR